MQICQGRIIKNGKDISSCASVVYVCTKCGMAGCTRSGCQNIRFTGGNKCTVCGNVGTRRL